MNQPRPDQPMHPPLFPDGPPPWPRPDADVDLALRNAYSSGDWGRYHGAFAPRLTETIQSWLGVPHAWLCCSGTIGIELALRGLQVSEGHEVILAAYDFPGNFRAIEMTGARPALVDLHDSRWVPHVDRLDAAVTAETKAAIVSHLHGDLVDMPLVMQWAEDRNIAIVEDCCQAPGASIQGKPVGAWGDVAVFSFGGSKLLTAGRGGALAIKRDDVLQRIKIYCERGNDAFALSELQAAVLLAQLPKLASQNQERYDNVRRLIQATADIASLRPCDQWPANWMPAFYKLAWHIDEAHCSLERDQLVRRLRTQGVAMDAGFRGFLRRGSRRCRIVGTLEEAKRAATRTVILHHPILLEPPEAIERLGRAIRVSVEG